MKYFVSIFSIFLAFQISAQGPVITNLNINFDLLKKQSSNPSAKRAINDTIQLPFFDDFTSSRIYPNMKYWVDSQVYINDHFAVSPPSYGVATFDNLDKKGRPYQAINGNVHNHSDSLTSNYINLKNYKNGLNTVNYTIADSIYLSFFYQTQGLGDPLDNSDSLVLKFKDSAGFWQTVWKTPGVGLKPFKQVLIPIIKTGYLNPDFQFRFINFGKTTGNMNQWHLDYVRLMQGRNRHDTVISDVAINTVPVGPLQWYESMPYDHFKVNPSFQEAIQHTVILRNNYISPVNVQFKCEVRNQYNQVIADYPLSSSARNVTNQSDFSESFAKYRFDTLSGKYPSMVLNYTIAPLSNDFTPSQYNSISDNNVYSKKVQFKNYFAYDDGSAEGGYGLDYGSLPAGPGYAAIKFQTAKPDTLRGLSIFFNRSVQDIQFKAFSLMIWQKISEPPAANTNGDVLLKKIDLATVVYTDSINGFTNFIFDTAIALNQGSFYIGWLQNNDFILNVGYDNNYKYAKTGGRNPNLFFNLNGYWEKVNANISGAVMMRPLVGEPIVVSNPSRLETVSYKNRVQIYPNPSSEHTVIHIQSERPINRYKIFTAGGKLVQEGQTDDIQSFNVSLLTEGVYFIHLTDVTNQTTVLKWIKLNQ